MFLDYATSSDSDEPITCSTPVKDVPPSLSAKHALTPDSKAAAEPQPKRFATG